MISGSDYSVESLRAGGIATVQFRFHTDLVTIATDGSTDVYYTVDGSSPVVGAGSKIASGSNEATVVCPSGPTVVKLLAGAACGASVVTGARTISRPVRASRSKRVVDD